MTLPRLVSFSGFALAGKDTAADTFVENQGFVKTYMSKPLEKALLTLDPFVNVGGNVGRYSWLHKQVGYDKSKENPEVRRLLQMLGTEVGRNMFGQNVWLDQIENEIHAHWSKGNKVVLTGVRYPNEMACVRQNGGITIWISRPGVHPVNDHTSDNSMGPYDCDYRFNNNGTPEELYEKMLPVLEAYTPPTVVLTCVYNYVEATRNFVCTTHEEILKYDVLPGEFDPMQTRCPHHV